MRNFCRKFVEKREFVILAVLLGAVFISTARWAAFKSGLYIDEGMTLYLSNGNYNGAVTTDSQYTLFDFFREFIWKDNIKTTAENIVNMIRQLQGEGNYSAEGKILWYDEARKLLQGDYAWTSGDELFEQIAVTRGTGFQYGQVLLNQAMDVHPPLYYLLVHTVFSFFPGQYTKWFLFGINIFFLLATLALMYQIIKKYFRSQSMAFWAVALLGFSQGFSSCAVYFRMYAVLTFFVMATYGVQLRLLESGFEIRGKNRILLLLTTILGFCTHYYFLLFFAGIVFVNGILLVRKREFPILLRYMKNILLSAILCLILWPFSLYHIFFGYRGTEAVTKLVASNFLENAGDYFEVLIKAITGGSKVIFVVALLMVGSIAIMNLFSGKFSLQKFSMKNLFLVKQKKDEKTKNITEWLFAVVPALFYSIFIIQITPVCEDRYLMCIFPFISMVLAWGIAVLADILGDRKIRRNAWLLSGIVLILINIMTPPNYLYLTQRGKEAAAQDKNCIMLLLDDAYAYENVPDLIKYPQVLVLTSTDVGRLRELHPDNPGKGFIIYIHEVLETEKLLEEACKALSGKEGKAEITQVDSKFEYMNAFVVEVAQQGRDVF